VGRPGPKKAASRIPRHSHFTRIGQRYANVRSSSRHVGEACLHGCTTLCLPPLPASAGLLHARAPQTSASHASAVKVARNVFLPPTPAPVRGKYACPHLAADRSNEVGGPTSSYLGSLVTVVVTVKDACSQVG